jgi:endonuclease/exonuclease/phosphatase family metal-dependent hydrolase
MVSWTRRAALAASLALLALAPAAHANGGPPPDVTVMSRNIYLGGDIFRPIGAPDRAEFERQAGLLWREVQQTNFPFRSKLLAREVQRKQPDLIGLQEVALWRRGPQGVKDGATTPATRVVYDFLAILRSQLRRRGLDYRVAVKQREADIEAPIDAGYDVRLTMRDVILVRNRPGLRVTRTRSANYTADISVPTPAGAVTSTRGWTAVDATLSGHRFRFVNTHLESALDSVRVAQAAELVGPGGPLRARRPMILVGDFNSDPEGRGGNAAGAYDLIEGAGFSDVWPRAHPNADGLTFGFNSDLSNSSAAGFTARIDLIWTKPRLRVLRASIVGKRRSDRRRGLWPSDHAGVVAELRLR